MVRMIHCRGELLLVEEEEVVEVVEKGEIVLVVLLVVVVTMADGMIMEVVVVEGWVFRGAMIQRMGGCRIIESLNSTNDHRTHLH